MAGLLHRIGAAGSSERDGGACGRDEIAAAWAFVAALVLLGGIATLTSVPGPDVPDGRPPGIEAPAVR